MWFLIVKWWLTFWYYDNSPMGITTDWSSPSNKGGWALKLARRFKLQIVVWRINRKTHIGVAYKGKLYLPDSSKVHFSDIVDHVIIALDVENPDKSISPKRISKQQYNYYVNKVR